MSLGAFASARRIKRVIELENLGGRDYLKDMIGVIIRHAAELCTTTALSVCQFVGPCTTTGLLGGHLPGGADRIYTSGGSGWLKGKKNSSGDGVFTMNTVSNSESKWKQNQSARASQQRLADGRLCYAPGWHITKKHHSWEDGSGQPNRVVDSWARLQEQ